MALLGTASKKRRWHEELKTLREHNWGTDAIGTGFDSILAKDPDDKQDFIKGLYEAVRQIKSFDGRIPEAFLRNAIGQDEGGVGYIQKMDYEPPPFLEAIRIILKLLHGVESH